MIKKYTFSIALLLANICLNAQVATAPVPEKGSYAQLFTEGNYLLLEENYLKALDSYLAAYKLDSANSNINFKIGYCYLKTESEKTLSLRYLAKAVKNTTKHYNEDAKDERVAPVNAFYYYALALHLNYKFNEAIANYEKFKSYLTVGKHDDLIKDANRMIQISKNAIILVGAPVTTFTISNMGDSINGAYPDYNAVITADENTLMFTSRRPGSTGGDLTDDGLFYEDIYVCYKKKDGSWTSPKSISPNINTNEHDASVGLIADGQTLLIYRGTNGGDIYSSVLQGDNWSFPQPMSSEINSENWETSACLSSDGNVIYFVSDRSGGIGGRDIWTCTKLPNGQWSKATNLGPTINTEFDEESPFIHPSTGTLFFSSTGHNTMGGFDIFYSEKNDKGWSEPLNIGYPVNTTDNDLYYVTNPAGLVGYYSSSLQASGYGEKDIYKIVLNERKEQALVLIKGLFIPAEGCALPSDLEIVSTNNESSLVGTYRPLMRDGTFTIIIPPNSRYTLSYTQGGEEFETEDINVPSDAQYREINKVIHLKGCKKGEYSIDHSKGTDSTVVSSTIKENGVVDNNKPDIKYASSSHRKLPKDSMISVEGFLFDKNGMPYADTKIHILNSKGEVVKTGTTTSAGGYIFTWLMPDEEYTIETEDPAIHLGRKSILRYRNNMNKVIKTVHLGNGDGIAAANKEGGNKNGPTAMVDKLNFIVYYKYNINEVDVNDSPFMTYMDNLAAVYKTNGKLNIEIESSASHVPTKTFKSNKQLAETRSTKIKEQILTGLKAKGIDSNKIKFVKSVSGVNGPEYSGDYLTNKATYEKYQYSKIKAY